MIPIYQWNACFSTCGCNVSVERYIGEEGRGVGTIIQLAMLRGRGEWIYCIAIPEGGERHTSLFSGLLCSFSRSSRSMPVRLFGSYLALKILSKDSKYSSLTLLTRSIWNPKTLFELQNRPNSQVAMGHRLIGRQCWVELRSQLTPSSSIFSSTC